jgi:hypothetical protein
LKHVRNHGRVDRAGADRIYADAARRIFHTRALGHPEHCVLGAMIGRASWETNETANDPEA